MILAIDLGSTFFKAAVFDQALNELGFGRAELQYRFDAGGVVEFGVAHAEERLRSAIREAMAQSRVHASDIRAIGITSQAQTFTICPASGNPKTPFISWQDVRPPQSSQAALPDFGLHCGFNECLPGLLVSKLMHLQDETKRRFIMPEDRVFLLPTWFVWKLTGKMVVDENMAVMTGLHSLVSNGWWPAALERCGISVRNLSALVPLATVGAATTKAAEEWGLPPGIPVVPAGNDQTAGAWGADLRNNRDLLLTLGTAQVAYRCLDALPGPAAGCLRGPYGKGLFYTLVADDCGGSIINWAETLLAGGTADDTFFDAAAKAPPGCEGLVFEPDLSADKGSWRGIGRHHTTAHFARSVVESLVARMAGMVARLDVDTRSTRVLVAGGGSQYAFWLDTLAKAMGTRVTQTAASPLLGAAKMAASAGVVS